MNLAPFGAPDFCIQEMAPPAMIERHGPYRCLQLIDHRILDLVQFNKDYLSAHFGEEVQVIINDYKWGGDYTLSGLRPFGTSTGSTLSQHKFGRAIDCKYKIARTSERIPADVVREEIILNDKQTWMEAGLTTVESGDFAPTWVHQDIRDHTLNTIFIVEPS